MEKIILFFIFTIIYFPLYPCSIIVNDEYYIKQNNYINKKDQLKNLILNDEYHNVDEAYNILKSSAIMGRDFNSLYLYFFVKNQKLDLLEKLFYESNSNVGKIYALRGIFELDKNKYNILKSKKDSFYSQGLINLYFDCSDIDTVDNYLKAIEESRFIDFNGL